MASTQSKLFTLLLRLINKKKYLRYQLASGRPPYFNSPEPTSKVKKYYHIHRFQVHGHNVFTLFHKNKPISNRLILYLHGGAYVQSFNIFHWNFLADLVRQTGCTIIAPDYPLAPGYTFKDSFAMASGLYQQIIAEIDPKDFIVMGDSAGGGFALALAQKMRNEGFSQPNRIILLSPWLDIRLENDDIDDIKNGDPFLEKQSLQDAGKLYAGDTDPSHYLLSPINGSFDNLGRIGVFIGSREIFVADTRKLKNLLTAKEISTDYYEYDEMFHGWMFLNFPESRNARKQIIDLVQQAA